jgi:D-glycerate 3-kinase
MDLFLDEFIANERLDGSFRGLVSKAYMPIAQKILSWKAEKAGPLVVAINGAQGTGKSTLSRFLSDFFRESAGLNACVLSLDDIYKTKEERSALGERVHPLLATRGVPGTHDTDLGIRLIERFIGGEGGTVRTPRFRKEIDDRAEASEWYSVSLPVDIVLFEGWCVSARAESAASLSEAINDFEAESDEGGVWRAYVNTCLEGVYRDLFALVDHTIMLRVPSFDCILKWRMEQEDKLRLQCASLADGTKHHFMSKAELRDFIAHFERLTRWMLKDMPSFSEIILDFNEDRSFRDLMIQDG